jgi:hypothetical protein
MRHNLGDSPVAQARATTLISGAGTDLKVVSSSEKTILREIDQDQK